MPRGIATFSYGSFATAESNQMVFRWFAKSLGEDLEPLHCIYPPVNCPTTMENHHFSLENYKWTVFHSYVRLPDGKQTNLSEGIAHPSI